jgi:hypothetical protein
LLQRLAQPTAANLAAEYASINKLQAFLQATLPHGCKLPSLPLPQQQYAALMQCWCSMVKPLLLLMSDQEALAQHPSAVYGAGVLFSMLAKCLECWACMAANKAAVKQHIAQHTAGG